MAKYAKYAYLGAYLGARNMVKWGVPEKILQNVVQAHQPTVHVYSLAALTMLTCKTEI